MKQDQSQLQKLGCPLSFSIVYWYVSKSLQLKKHCPFGSDSQNKVTVTGLIWNLLPIMARTIIVNMQNLKLLAVLLLEIWRHKNFLSRREQVIAIRYLPPGIEQSLKKSLFMPENLFCDTKLSPPPVFAWFSRKTKISYVQFFETSHSINNYSSPPG